MRRTWRATFKYCFLKDGSAYYGSGGKYGHHDQKYDQGHRDGYGKWCGVVCSVADVSQLTDAEGGKKYSYYVSGSGPAGKYSKGYYGSEGKEIFTMSF